jgi:hypothetical protein
MPQVKKDIRYLNKDFSQFRANLIEFAKNYFPDTYNDFNESSPGMMFIEMASYVGDVLSYYTDNQLKESFLESANYRPNVLSLAANTGYKIKNTIPATVDLDVFQLLPAIVSGSVKVPDWNYALTIDEGMTVQAVNSNVSFRTANLINFHASSSFDPTEVSVYQINDVDSTPEYYLLKKAVKAIAGTVKTQTFQFGSAKRFDKILLQDTNIIEVLSITDSDGNNWTEVPYLAQDTVFESVANTVQNSPDLYTYTNVPYLMKLVKTARRYVTKFRADSNLEIQFGAGVSAEDDQIITPNPDNVGMNLVGLQLQYDQPIDPSNFMYTKTYGLAPSNTTLTVTYTVGGGIESNVPSLTLTNVTGITFSTDPTFLDSTLLNTIKASVATTNPNPAAGGKSQESLEDIRQNAMANFAAQQRNVTDQDYIVRAYTMPSRFGSVAKAYVIQDHALNHSNVISNTRQSLTAASNPLAINLYTLGYDSNGNYAPLNPAVKSNLQTYINMYRMLTDAVNIKDAYIINIGIKFEIITLPEYNSNQVVLNCINAIKAAFDSTLWQINQPIILSKLYTMLDRVDGVQSVKSLQVSNLFDVDSGYSGNVYDIAAATKDNVIYPSLDPSIFEIKYPNKDIIGKVVSL